MVKEHNKTSDEGENKGIKVCNSLNHGTTFCHVHDENEKSKLSFL